MHEVVRGALVAVLALGLLAGCGDDDPPTPAPSGSTTSPTKTTSPSEATSPTGEPPVEPAGGKQETFGSFTMSFPKGWDVRPLSAMAMAASGPDGEHLGVSAVPTTTQLSTDRLARDAVEDASFVGKPVRFDDVEVDGVLMYHVRGPLGADQTRDLVGAEYGGYEMTLQLTTQLPEAAQQELVESLLASITWS